MLIARPDFGRCPELLRPPWELNEGPDSRAQLRWRPALAVSRETQTSAQSSTLRRRPLDSTASYDGWVIPANTYHTRVFTLGNTS